MLTIGNCCRFNFDACFAVEPTQEIADAVRESGTTLPLLNFISEAYH